MIVNHPAAQRNAEPIYGVVRETLDGFARRSSLRALELASGPGQHVELFATRHPEVCWQPSEPQEALRASIDARVALAELANVLPALDLDVCAQWPNERYDLIFAVNLLHISPWSVTQALVANAAASATDQAVLLIYGPFKRNSDHTSEGNAAFDAQLRERDAQWGIRDVEAVTAVADQCGWRALSDVSMPANNFCLLYRRQNQHRSGRPD